MCVAIQRTATSKEPNACVGFWSVIFSPTNVSEVCISLTIVSVFALFFCYWVFLKNWSSQRHSLPILIPTICLCVNHATMYASQHIWCLFQARIKWEGCGRKGIRRKNGDDAGGSLISPDGVAPSRMVSVSASVIFPCTIKIQKTSYGTGSPG